MRGPVNISSNTSAQAFTANLCSKFICSTKPSHPM
jgi:hypothetical protein